jgi:hypothetical protein
MIDKITKLMATKPKWAVALLCALTVGCGSDTEENDNPTPLECERTTVTEFEECNYGLWRRTASTQQEISKLCASRCTIATGIYLEYSDRTDLSFATGLTELEAELLVEHNDQLKNLRGLDDVTVFGSEYDGYSRIIQNENLESLEGLDSLRRVNEAFTIQYNGIESLHGLESLEEVEGDLVIDNNWNLTDLKALESLERVGEDLFVESNENLPRCEIDWLVERIDIEGEIRMTGNGAETAADCS